MEIDIARILIIAGSDSGGGAGIQGDIKTVTCLGGYAATAITALTAQNTTGVYGIYDVPEEFIAKQINLVLEDIGADAIKTGMLSKAGVIEIIADCLANYPQIPLVLDPVMFAKGGAALLLPSALATLKNCLISRAEIITPNIPEAEFLAEMEIKTINDMSCAAEKILALGCNSVLIKGGHLQGEIVTDLLATNDDETIFSQPRINSKNTHGTGCALASAIATGLAQKLPLHTAVVRARQYVQKAIETAPNIGKGYGALGHGHTVQKFFGQKFFGQKFFGQDF
jgi:hydroxymethylpyrimidine/phosphomethylpyrimidine kinase